MVSEKCDLEITLSTITLPSIDRIKINKNRLTHNIESKEMYYYGIMTVCWGDSVWSCSLNLCECICILLNTTCTFMARSRYPFPLLTENIFNGEEFQLYVLLASSCIISLWYTFANVAFATKWHIRSMLLHLLNGSRRSKKRKNEKNKTKRWGLIDIEGIMFSCWNEIAI